MTFEDFWLETCEHHYVLKNMDDWRFGQRLFNFAPQEFQQAVVRTPIDPFYKDDSAVGDSYSDLEQVWNEVIA